MPIDKFFNLVLQMFFAYCMMHTNKAKELRETQNKGPKLKAIVAAQMAE
jgi:hypothetical protein